MSNKNLWFNYILPGDLIVQFSLTTISYLKFYSTNTRTTGDVTHQTKKLKI